MPPTAVSSCTLIWITRARSLTLSWVVATIAACVPRLTHTSVPSVSPSRPTISTISFALRFSAGKYDSIFDVVGQAGTAMQ